MVSIRKRAGAGENERVRESRAGMPDSMMGRVKEALAGRTGNTDDEED